MTHSSQIALHTFPTHESPIPRPLTTFPESTASLANKRSSANPTVLWSVNLLAGAEATDHISILRFASPLVLG